MAIKIGKLFGVDKLIGTDDDDLLIALGARTILGGGKGNDILLGGLNDDILIGGKGADILSGGRGNDTADYSSSDAGVTVSLTTGRGFGGDAQGDTLISIENIVGSAFDDTLTGDRGNNVLTGGGGSDIFVVTSGHDTITDFTPTKQVSIDFNDLPAGFVPNGYGGLDWSSVVTNHYDQPSGYQNAGLGTNIAFNPGGAGASFRAAGPDFTLQSAYMAAGVNDDLEVTVTGWDHGTLKATQTFMLGVERTLITFVGFDSVDEVTFRGVGGTAHGFPAFGGGTQVVWDDIKLVFDGREDSIDVPVGTDIAALVAGAAPDGHGGTLLTYQGGHLTLQGIAPESVQADWFI